MDDPRLPSMRAADADRERVLEVLRQGHAEGRLTTSEFYERLESVHRAKTYAELDTLVRDLPSAGTPTPSFAPPPRPVAKPAAAASLSRLPKELRAMWVTWATVVSINVLIWLIIAVTTIGNSREAPYFWPIWVAGPWGVVLAGITATWWLNRKDGPEPPALPPGRG